VDAALGADRKADRRGRAVGHEHRDGERRDPLGALLLEDVVLVEQGDRATDTGADDDRYPQRVHAGVGGAGVPPGLLGGDDRHLLAAVQSPGAHAVDLIGRVDGEPCDELGRVVLDPVVGDPADPGPPGEQGVPGAVDVAAQGRGGTEPSDDDVNGRHAHSSSSWSCGRAAGMAGPGPAAGAGGGTRGTQPWFLSM
jgi:hypothetical protein